MTKAKQIEKILKKFLLTQREADKRIYVDSFSIDHIPIHLSFFEKRFFKKNKKKIIEYLFNDFELQGYKKTLDVWKTSKYQVIDLIFIPVE